MLTLAALVLALAQPQPATLSLTSDNTRVEKSCILEIAPDYAGLHSEVIDGGLILKDGYILPPDRPGLGIVLTEETRRRYPFQPGSGEFNSVPGKILTD